tara:strand:- start:3989 stop:5176 length:1188 start_codon:yes stop_codon:yes gene_type:complete
MLSFKYIPQSFEEILGNKETCCNLLNNIQSNSHIFHIVSGSIGSGKTTIIKNVVNEYNKHIELIDVDLDCISTKHIIEKLEKILNNINISKKERILIIEDIEIYESLNLNSIFQYIYTKCIHTNTVVITSCNSKFTNEFIRSFDKMKIPYNLCSVMKPSAKELFKFTKRVCKLEQKNVPNIKNFNDVTDIRFFLNNLDSQNAKHLYDQTFDYSEIITKLTCPDIPIVEKFKISKCEITPLPIHIFESYLAHAEENLNTYFSIMNSVIFGDYLYTKMFTNQMWELMNDTILFSIIIPTYHFKQNSKVVLSKPAVWSRYSNMCLKRKIMKILMYKMNIYNQDKILSQRQELINSIKESNIIKFNDYDILLIKCFDMLESSITIKELIKKYNKLQLVK